MNQLNNDSQKFIKHFLAIAPKHCDNCGFKYTESDFKVIKSTPQGIVIHLACQNCKNNYVLNVMNPINGLVGTQRAPLNLDLSGESELMHFAGKDAVNKNDALDAYNTLNGELSKDDILKLLQH